MHQTRLPGVWLKPLTEGCPHIIRKGNEDAEYAICEINMKSCVYDQDPVCRCSTFAQILAEWESEPKVELKVRCTRCGRDLDYFGGLETLPEHLFCPDCADWAYTLEGEKLARLGG
jgi:hypothetical protein